MVDFKRVHAHTLIQQRLKEGAAPLIGGTPKLTPIRPPLKARLNSGQARIV